MVKILAPTILLAFVSTGVTAFFTQGRSFDEFDQNNGTSPDDGVHMLGNSRCLPHKEATPADVAGARDCNNYLLSLGTQSCEAGQGGSIMCRSGRAIVKGFPNGVDTAASYCRDVATAVAWVLDHCPACGGDNCDVAGYQAAGGNGNLIIKVSGA